MHRDVRDAGQNQTSGDDALVTVEAASQMMMVLSSDAEAIWEPVGLQDTLVTAEVWPVSTDFCSPDAASQMIMVLRNASMTRRAPARGARAASDELVGQLLTFPFAEFSEQSFQNLEPRAKNVENALYILYL